MGVLRSGAENVAWTDRGEATDWTTARLEVITALKALAVAEGRQEYRVQIDGQDGIVSPGLAVDGQVAIEDLDRVLPADRYWS